MSTIKRLSRHRREVLGDPIQIAWDRGDLPPPAAFEPPSFEPLLDCIFFRWATHKPLWAGEHHPYASAWHDALVASRSEHMRRSRRRGGALRIAAVEDGPDAAA